MTFVENNFKELRDLFHSEYYSLIRLIHEMEYYDKHGDDLYYCFFSDRADGIYDVIDELDNQCFNLEWLVSKVSELNDSTLESLKSWIKSYWALKEKNCKDIDEYVRELFESDNFRDVKSIFFDNYKILINLVHSNNYSSYKGSDLFSKFVKDSHMMGRETAITAFKASILPDHMTELLYDWIHNYWVIHENEGFELDDYIKNMLY